MIHDVTSNGVGFWSESPNSELYGSLIYNNGWSAPDRGHGHGVYTQNADLAQPKKILSNLFLANYGYLFQAYGSSTAKILGYKIEGNVLIGGTGFIGGRSSTEVAGMQLIGNYLFRSGLSLGYEGATVSRDLTLQGNWLSERTDLKAFWQSALIRNNKFIDNGTSGVLHFSTDNYDAAKWNWNENEYYSNAGNYLINIEGLGYFNLPAWRVKTGFDSTTTLSPLTAAPELSLVQPNLYEPTRTHIVIYNWSQKTSVSVDVSGLSIKAGDLYELRNASNYYGDIVSGVFSGGTLSVPMTGHNVAHQRNTSDAALMPLTFPTFGAFVLSWTQSGAPKAPSALKVVP